MLFRGNTGVCGVFLSFSSSGLTPFAAHPINFPLIYQNMITSKNSSCISNCVPNSDLHVRGSRLAIKGSPITFHPHNMLLSKTRFLHSQFRCIPNSDMPTSYRLRPDSCISIFNCLPNSDLHVSGSCLAIKGSPITIHTDLSYCLRPDSCITNSATFPIQIYT